MAMLPAFGQTSEVCLQVPQARVQQYEINQQPYINIERLSFSNQLERPVDQVSFYVVIESESGDFYKEWGPYKGPSSLLFQESFGPLLSADKSFEIKFESADDDDDCSNQLNFEISDGPFSKTPSEDEPLESWDGIFDHIEAYDLEDAVTELNEQRNFNRVDADLFEFAQLRIDKAKNERFEVYFDIYPNPAENVVFIHNVQTKERELRLVIMDLEGDIKMKRDFEVAEYLKVRMNINRLRSGNYICAVMNKNGRIIGMKHLYKM